MTPGACLSLWPTEECAWSTWDIWHSADIVERAIYVSFALMLVYTLFLLLRFIRSSVSIPREFSAVQLGSGPEFQPERIRLISHLTRAVGTLRGIAVAAPFLGLAGTSYGILAVFSYGGSWSRGSFLYYICPRLAFTLTTTIVGTLVAILVIVCHNILGKRVEDLAGRLVLVRKPHFGLDRRAVRLLPLRKRFSGPPHFALIAAPIFACWLMFYIGVDPRPAATGLRVLLPQDRCQAGLVDRSLVLRVTNNGKLFLNYEPEDWKGISARLSEIYGMRRDRVLYFLAEDEVPFQVAAEAIDTARSSRDNRGKSLDISVRLVTPQTVAEDALCHAPRWIGKQASR